MLQNGNSPNTPPGPELQGNRTGLDPQTEAALCKIFCWCNKRGNSGGDFIQKIHGGPMGPQMA